VARYDRLIHRSWTKLPTYLFSVFILSNNVEDKTKRTRLTSALAQPALLILRNLSGPLRFRSKNQPNNATASPVKGLLRSSQTSRNPFFHFLTPFSYLYFKPLFLIIKYFLHCIYNGLL